MQPWNGWPMHAHLVPALCSLVAHRGTVQRFRHCLFRRLKPPATHSEPRCGSDWAGGFCNCLRGQGNECLEVLPSASEHDDLKFIVNLIIIK